MINLVKKYEILLLLAGIILVLFLVKVFFTGKPSPSVTAERLPIPSFAQENITNRTVSYQFNFSPTQNFPTSLLVYKISSLKTETFPEIKPDFAGSPVITLDQTAVQTAKAFLGEKGVGEEFAGLSQLQYLKIDKTETFSASSSAEADIFVVNFWPQIKTTTVVTDKPSSPPTSIWVGKNGKIEKAFATTFSIEEAGSFSLRTLEIAAQDISQQKATLVWLDNGGTLGYAPPRTVLNVVLEKVSLAYFLPSSSQELLEPIFVFEGKAQIQGEGSVAAAVYLPALAEKYFTNPEP